MHIDAETDITVSETRKHDILARNIAMISQNVGLETFLRKFMLLGFPHHNEWGNLNA